MTSGKMEKWKPNYFESNHLPYLPVDVKLDRDTIVVDYLRKHELKTAFSIIESAAAAEYNVGTDEIDWDFFVEFVSDVSEAFAVRYKDGADIVALVLLHPSIYSRTMAPCVGYFEIFLTPALYAGNKDAYRELARLTTTLADDVGLKYVAVLTQVFCTCVDMVQDLRALDFHLVACLPRCGNLRTRTHVDSYLLYKEFSQGVDPDHVRPFEEIARYAEHVTQASGLWGPYEEDTGPLMEAPGLPVRYTFKRAGITAIWRNVRKSDAPVVYKMITEAAESGVGFSMEEHPTFNFYYHWHFKTQYGVIVEEEGTGKIIAYNAFSGYWPYRTLTPDVLEGTIIVVPEYRGKGVSQEVGTLCEHIYAELGFKGMLSDSALVNVPMHESQVRLGYTRVGYVPKSVYLENQGYIDSIYSYKRLDSIIPFSEKINQMDSTVISKL